MIIDTHCHLFEEDFKEDLEECIKRAKKQNILKAMIVGFSTETNKLALDFANRYKGFFNTAGIHPSEASLNYNEKLKELEEFIKLNKVYAVGECGLDYHYGTDNKEYQKLLFIGQIELSIKYDLPLIIHMRDATFDTYSILENYRGKIRGVMHCYSSSYEMALKFIDLGFYISLGGPVTFKNAKEPKKCAINLPLDKMLVETDSPFLAPTPYRGKRNETSFIIKIIEEIAQLRNISCGDVENSTSQNALKLFNI